MALALPTRVRGQYEEYPFPTYHQINQYVEWVGHIIRNCRISGNSVLDIGCGTGAFSCAFAKLGYKVKGVDFSESSVRVAKSAARRLNLSINFEVCDLFRYEDGDKYDIVMCYGVLHHTNKPYEGFKKIASFVKPSGFVILYLYNSNMLNLRFARYVVRLAGGNSFERRLNFSLRLKPLLLLLVNPRLLKDYAEIDNNIMVDIFCHAHSDYFSSARVRRWLENNSMELLDYGGPSLLNILFRTLYVGRKKY